MSKERNDQMPWESDTEFNAWVRSLPEKTWAKNDISACRLGWEAHKHNLAQPEWPSEEDADRVWDALSERCGENDFPSIDDVRAALQSVRPPVGVVSGKFSNQDEWTVVDCSGCGRCVAFVKKDASRHTTTAPTKD